MTEFQKIIEERNPTWQEYIDEVKRRVDAKLFPCKTGVGTCRYRHGEKQCIVGVLIPDSRYDTDKHEGKRAYHVLKAVRLPDGMTPPMLGILQGFHDRSMISGMVEFLEAFAEGKFPDGFVVYFEGVLVNTLEELNAIEIPRNKGVSGWPSSTCRAVRVNLYPLAGY